MSLPPTPNDIASVIGAATAPVVLLATPRIMAAMVRVLTVLVALWHPDKTRRAEAVRLLRYTYGREPANNQPAGPRTR